MPGKSKKGGGLESSPVYKKQKFGTAKSPFKMKLTGGVHFTQPSKAVYRGAFHSPANEGMNYQDYIRTHRGVRK